MADRAVVIGGVAWTDCSSQSDSDMITVYLSESNFASLMDMITRWAGHSVCYR